MLQFLDGYKNSGLFRNLAQLFNKSVTIANIEYKKITFQHIYLVFL